MSDLSPSARALIQSARMADEPTLADRAETDAALVAHLGAAALVVTGGGAGAAGAAAGTKAAAGAGAKAIAGAGTAGLAGAKAAVGIALATKPAALLVGGILSAAVIWGGVSVTRAHAPWHKTAAAPPPEVTQVMQPPKPAPRPVSAASLAAPPHVVPEETPSPPPTSTEERQVLAPPSTTNGERAPRTTLGPSALPHSLGDEARLLRDALNAMQAGYPDQALSLLDQHAARYPHGSMRAERSAERVLVLCRLERTDEARAEASRFLAEFPTAPLAARVRASCAGP